MIKYLLVSLSVAVWFIADLSHGSTSISSVVPIRFVVTNYKGISFVIQSDGALWNLYNQMARSCDISFPFHIQSANPSRETIVDSRDAELNKRKFVVQPSIVSTMQTLHDFYQGEEFQIPIRVYPLCPSDEAIAMYNSLSQMFKKMSVQEFEWYKEKFHEG